jgi:hypothetical protein
MNKSIFGILFILSILVISGCEEKPIEPGIYDEFATCLVDSGLKMYGSFTCAICERQRDLFGPSFHIIGEIEFNPHGENPQSELCLEKNVKNTPTWILEEDGKEPQVFEGYQKLETLSEISGCPLDVS